MTRTPLAQGILAAGERLHTAAAEASAQRAAGLAGLRMGPITSGALFGCSRLGSCLEGWMDERESAVERPVPGLEPRRITMAEYEAFTPEKLELWEGYLIDPPGYPDQRRDLLLLLLVNQGLLDAVRLAPADQWHAALRQVYGEP